HFSLPLIETVATPTAAAEINALARPDTPLRMSAYAEAASQSVPANPPPIVEAPADFIRWNKLIANRDHTLRHPSIHTLSGPRRKRVDHRQFQTALRTSQGSRGTCWAFAAIAALEAAYARQGVNVKLSEHYLFHISKAHEDQIQNGTISSLVGFQGGPQ